MFLVAGDVAIRATFVNCCGTFCLAVFAESADGKQTFLTRKPTWSRSALFFFWKTKFLWLLAISWFNGLMTTAFVDRCWNARGDHPGIPLYGRYCSECVLKCVLRCCRLSAFWYSQVRTLEVGNSSKLRYQCRSRSHYLAGQLLVVMRRKWAFTNSSGRSWDFYLLSPLEVVWSICGYCGFFWGCDLEDDESEVTTLTARFPHGQPCWSFCAPGLVGAWFFLHDPFCMAKRDYAWKADLGRIVLECGN